MTTTGQQGVSEPADRSLPPLAELVTEDDVRAALEAADLTATPSSVETMRAALEAYAPRLLGRTPTEP